MTKQIKVILTEQELRLLSQIATKQCRRTQDHARFLIVSALGSSPDLENSKSATSEVSRTQQARAFAQ